MKRAFMQMAYTAMCGVQQGGVVTVHVYLLYY